LGQVRGEKVKRRKKEDKNNRDWKENGNRKPGKKPGLGPFQKKATPPKTRKKKNGRTPANNANRAGKKKGEPGKRGKRCDSGKNCLTEGLKKKN